MNIAVIGTGYVGLVTGTCFAEMGNKVTCVDVDNEKIDKLNQGIIPIYEPGLKELVHDNIQKSLFFSTDIENTIQKSEIIFIAVGTPMLEDGNADLSSVFNVAKTIGKNSSSYKIVVTKSTVPVGTTFKVRDLVMQEFQKREVDLKVDFASNPEFLKEGAAIHDFMKPDRVVIGAEKEEVFDKMKELYHPFFRANDRFITMDICSSEMTKYAANAMLATKISFINEIANICEKVGADINKVRMGIGSDKRIGYDFIYPGIGYGGTCFPKDISALINLGKKEGYKLDLISSVDTVNKNQKKLFFNKIIKRFGNDLTGFVFAIWGLSFKPETDDMRDSPATYIVKELEKRGASIHVFDPKAMHQAKKLFKDIKRVFYGQSKYEVLHKANALILLTEWKEFRSPDFEEIKNQLEESVIFDGRNQYNSFNLKEKGFEYYQIGKT